MKNRIAAGILVTAMLLYMVSAVIPSVFADSGTINISDKEDFIEFAKNCTLDTWSQGKSVNLTCDIDFDGADFSPVPSFGGLFNGNGYTISGINVSKNGSYTGVFRYIQSGGKVTDLNVEANFIPGGSKSFIGGIAGENAGVIERCAFEGNIKGENVIGGIVGNNTNSGKLIACTSSGIITGENSTGGIAGKNDGFIQNCTNNAAVNTVYEEKENVISDIDTDTGSIIENYKNSEEETEEESVLGHSDTGGIVGYTSGIVQGCTNNAAVGYQHIGYNVGGIAGRQSGYLLGCRNSGFIQGRKDVGGIAGQVEPYILLNVSETTLQDIRQELNNLHAIVDKFINDADSLGDDAEKHLTNISAYSENALDNAEAMINQGADFIDDNLDEINAQAAVLLNTLDKFTPVFDSMEKGSNNLADSLDKVAASLDGIKLYTPDLSSELGDISFELSDMSDAERNFEKAASKASRAIYDLEDAVEFNNKSLVKSAASDLSKAVREMIVAKQIIKNSLKKIETILTAKPDSFESIGINAVQIAENIKIINNNLGTAVSSMQTVTESLDTILLNTEIDFSEIRSAARNMDSAIIYLNEAVHYIGDEIENLSSAVTDGIDDLSSAVEKSSDEIKDYADDMIGQLNNAKDGLTDALAALSYAADDIETAVSGMKQIITDLSDEEPMEFVKLGDDFKNAGENLFDSLSGISDEIDGLKDAVSSGKDKIMGNLRAVSSQFNLVMNLIIGKVEELKDGSGSVTDIFLDVSDEDIENTRQGKVAECHNSGNVEADRNTGGIAGAMAVEYSKDPEDDIEKPDTLNFTYQTKAILQSCVNEGRTVGKKDCTGGIVGLAEIGTVYECENYGDTESTSGNYVGGIAGKSESAVRKSYAKSRLTGKRYIGGIAGKGNKITASYAIVNVSGDENTGAVCGDAGNIGSLYNNFFVDGGLGAVDGISYKGKAEHISFEELKDISGIPSRFISFTVTFIADGEIIETQEIKYGDDTARIKYPPIPAKDGHFGNWQEISAETVTENIEVFCEYKPYITILASAERNENGKLSLALAEGEFTDKAELHITVSKDTQPVKVQGDLKVYDISLSDTGIKDSDTVTLRLLNENKDKVTAWRLSDGVWEQIETAARGQYVILQAAGTKNTICMEYTEKGFNIIWLVLIAAVIIFSALMLIKTKHKKIKPSLPVNSNKVN